MADKFVNQFEIKRCERKIQATREKLTQLQSGRLVGGVRPEDVDDEIHILHRDLIAHTNHLSRLRVIKSGPNSDDAGTILRYRVFVIKHLGVMISNLWAHVESGPVDENYIQQWDNAFNESLEIIEAARKYYPDFEQPPIDKRNNKKNRVLNIIRHFDKLEIELASKLKKHYDMDVEQTSE